METQTIKYLTQRYNEQCDKFPRTRELSLQLYIKRNLRHAIINLKAKGI